MDLNAPASTIRNYFDYIQTPSDYGKFYGYEHGLDPFIRNFLLGQILMPLYIHYNDPDTIVH